LSLSRDDKCYVTSPPSKSFGDFEEEWIRLGKESYVGVFDSG
jgi:hypothetical protein